jgi:hypothetical protein
VTIDRRRHLTYWGSCRSHSRPLAEFSSHSSLEGTSNMGVTDLFRDQLPFLSSQRIAVIF